MSTHFTSTPAAAPPAPADSPGDDAAAVLEALATSSGLTFNPATARHALALAAQEQPGPWLETWVGRLTQAGRAVGCRITRFQASVREAANLAAPDAPVVRYHEGNGDATWVVLLGARGGSVRLADLARPGESAWESERGLVRRLGAHTPGESFEWVTAEATAPCAALGTPGDADGHEHGHEGHHGQHGHAPSPFRRLLGLLRTEDRDIRLVLTFGIGVGILTLASPIAVEALVNSVAFGTVQQLLVLTLILLGCLCLSAAMVAMQNYVVELMQQRIFVRVTADLAYRLPRVRAEAFDRHHGPELVNRFFEVLTVQKASAVLLLDGLTVVIQAIIGMALVAFYHPFLLGFDIALLVAVTFVLVVLGRGGVRTSIQESLAKYAVAGWLEEMARSPLAFKLGGGTDYALDRADGLARTYLQARRAHWRIVFRQFLGALALQVVAGTALLGLGGWLVIEQRLTLGQLVAAELVIAMALSSFVKLGKSLHYYYDLMASMDKLGHLVDLPLERDGGEALPPRAAGASLRLRDVSYSYDGHTPVMHGLNLTVAPGERVAVVGHSGAGKTTLLELLFGLREPSHGSIQIDGLDLRDLRLETLRGQVAVVGVPDVYEGTVLDNVRMGRPSVTVLDVRNALERVGLLDEVLALPDGLHTRLATGGKPLSEGRAYRLTVARALAGRPRLLAVDHGIDLIDRASRERLVRGLLDREAPWTLLLVTEDQELRDLCDREVALAPADHDDETTGENHL